MLNDFLARIPPDEMVPILALVLGFAGAVLVGLPAIMFSHFRAMRETRITSNLKRDLVARGLPIDEIERLVRVRPGSEPAGQSLSTPHEVVVHFQGEWLPAIVLKRAEHEWYVHYVGNDPSDNEWVGSDRIRFPLAFFASEGLTPEELLAAGGANHSLRKPEGVGLDL